jgi:hypothetical protein
MAPLKVFWEGQSTEVDHENDEDVKDSLLSNTPFKREEIHIPGVTRLKNEKEEEKVRGFETPVEYIQYQDRTELDYDDVVEYDMDSDDEHWLPKAKKMNWGKKYNFTMTPEIFEIIIDYLEKESFKQKEFSQLMVENEGKYPTVSNMDDDDDLPCCVCNEGDSDASNLIVFCDGCDIAVHQECQGIKVVPSGTWLCDRCAFDDTLKNKKKSSHSSPTRTSKKAKRNSKSSQKKIIEYR